MGDANGAAVLARFMAHPTASGIMREGLQWLARLARYSQPDAIYWREVADPLADLLTYAWELPDNQLWQHAPAFEAFKILPKALVTR